MDAPARKDLTDRTIKALKAAPTGKRHITWDEQVPHLGVRVTDRAADEEGHAAIKSFIVVRRRPGQRDPETVVLGRYPTVTLKDARDLARRVLGTLSAGKTPAMVEAERKREEEEQRLKEARKRGDTFASVAEDFIKRHVQAKLRSAKAGEALIKRELIAPWGTRPITEITKRDVIELIERAVDRGAPYAAHHILASVRKLFNWAIARDAYGLDRSPCAGVKAADIIGKPHARTRVLSDAELRLVWRAAAGLKSAYPFGTLVQVLMFTGQRLREVSDARRSEIDGTILTVPVERMKGKIAHTVPLTPAVVKLLATAPRFDGDTFIFSTTGGKRPISGFSKYKATLDREVANLIAEEHAKGGDVKDIAPWTLHDLRRTARTRLSALGILPLVAELVIGHKQAGINAVYDLHTYDAEKRAALEKWEAALSVIVGIAKPPKGAAVVTADEVENRRKGKKRA